MDQLLPVIFVSIFIAFIMMKQIRHVVQNIDSRPSTNNFEKYSRFSVIIQNAIRTIKNDIDSSKEKESPKYSLINSEDEEQSLETLADFLRKLVFFETLLAKQKSKSEIESELFAVLSSLDVFIKEKCQDGQKLADELKDELFAQYEG